MSEPRSPAPRRNAIRLGDLLGPNLAPALKKRGFATADLIVHWPQIAGPVWGRAAFPDQLSWPRRPRGVATDNDVPEPAVLTVRCSGAMSLRLAHDAPVLAERINTYFGFRAVGRIKILQVPMLSQARRPAPPPAPLAAAEADHIGKVCGTIEDDALRAIMTRLGTGVRRRRRDARKD